MQKTFFAWADSVHGWPMPGSPPEHTWVTTFEPVELCPPDASLGEYWYCWGICHRTPPANEKARCLSSGEGSVTFALRTAAPNDQRADAGLRYGIHGVCHQIANRILYATAIGGQTPITVEGARGFELSVAMFGLYGGKGTHGLRVRQAWRSRIEAWQRSGHE